MKNILRRLEQMGKVNAEGTVVFNESEIEHKALDFRKLFIKVPEGVVCGFVINGSEVLLDNGDLVKFRDLVVNFKEETRKVFPKINNFIQIQNCFTNVAFIHMRGAKVKTVVPTGLGMVKSMNDNGTYNIVVDGQNYVLPTMALKRIPNTIMSVDMKNIYEYMLAKGKSIALSPEYNYMEITDCGKFIRYIASDRLSRFDGAFWNEELRKKFCVNKKIRGVMTALFDTATHEDIDSALMLYGKSNMKVEILEGQAIYEAFEKGSNVMEGTLGNSCMIGKNVNLFKIYEENARIAVVRNDSGKIILRAMLWNIQNESGKKATFLDRIYSSNDSLIPMLQNWAKSNKFYMLGRQCHSESKMFNPDGKKISINDWHVKLNKADYDFFPYSDTFYLLVGTKLYSNIGVRTMHSTGGDLGTIN